MFEHVAKINENDYVIRKYTGVGVVYWDADPIEPFWWSNYKNPYVSHFDTVESAKTAWKTYRRKAKFVTWLD